MLETIRVETPGHAYDIHLGEGVVLKGQMVEGASALEARRWIIVTDQEVHRLYPQLANLMPGEILGTIVIPPGEASKTMGQAEKVLEEMAQEGLTRKDGVFAVGGGVVGDLAGFCASVYMRGISWIQVPTTLLSQVDSSVGGKTGVNLKQGKNLVGSFYQPDAVWIDPLFLQTLPDSEYWSGCGEVIKYGIIQGSGLQDWLKAHWDHITRRDPGVLRSLTKTCLECKAAIVAADEKEAGMRKILNFGHTAGHAIEKCLHYQITHGEALRWGMLMELELACRLHWLFRETCQELKDYVELIPAGKPLPDIANECLVQAMAADKKNQDDRISFLLPQEPGGLEEIRLSPDEVLRLLD